MKRFIFLSLIIVFSLALIAAAPTQEGLPDFGNMPLEAIVAWLIGAVYGVIQVFVPGVSVFQLIKKLFKLADVWAHVAVIGVSIGLGFLAMWLGGAVGFVDYKLDTVLGFIFSLYAASQLAYQKLKVNQAKAGMTSGP